jgi:selenium-binding protein 1
MATLIPDPTFYATPKQAMSAPRETLAYTVVIDPSCQRPDALVVLDVNPQSPTYGREVGRLDMPNTGDELHHFGWNACSAALCPTMPHPHVERRYLLIPGLRSSQIYVVDTKPDPRQPRLLKTISAAEIAKKSGYSRPHTVHCGPDALYINALGAPDGDGPGGVFLLDHNTFEVKGAWEKDRGPQFLAYDFWWHLNYDTMITSEWGTPEMVEDGVNPEILLAGGYGHQLHIWDLKTQRHVEALELGKEQQMALELRPAHNPRHAHGFVGVVTSLKDLSGAVFLWYREGNKWKTRKVIEVPAEPADPAQLPPLLKGFGAVPPVITDINLSLDDRFLYVACWGTGELRQYDVSDPFQPRLTGSLHLGGILRKAGHPASDQVLNGGPQMIEISRDGRRVYITNSLYAAWDAQFYPEGIRGWAAKIDVGAEGGMQFDPNFLVDFGELRPHQIRLEGGDSSSDSFCYPD